MRALADQGLLEHTVVIVAADHGEELREHGWIGHNVQVFEPTVRVPLIIRFPKGTAPAGKRVSALSDLLDIAPTIADIFGVRGKGGSDREFQGQSLLPVVLGAPGKPAVLSRSVWDRPRYALRDDRFKFFYDSRTGEEQLFDLVTDPGRDPRRAPRRSRCGRPTTARRSTPGRCASRAAPPAVRTRRRSAVTSART